jgi:hypothetical protein
MRVAARKCLYFHRLGLAGAALARDLARGQAIFASGPTGIRASAGRFVQDQGAAKPRIHEFAAIWRPSTHFSCSFSFGLMID